jgi:hypothetical protein
MKAISNIINFIKAHKDEILLALIAIIAMAGNTFTPGA